MCHPIRWLIHSACVACATLAMLLSACGAKESDPFTNLLWTYDAHDWGIFWSVPTVANGVVYLAGHISTEGHQARLVALDEATGGLKWSYFNNDLWQMRPLVRGGLVFTSDFHLYSGNMLAIDTATGQLRWMLPKLLRPVITPADTDTALSLVVNADGDLLAVELSRGEVVSRLPLRKDGSFAVGDGLAYVVDPRGQLLALDVFTGERKWQIATEPLWNVARPVVANGLVYVHTRLLSAFDAQSGEKRWTYARETAATVEPFVMSDGTLLVWDKEDENVVRALDGKSGAELWSSASLTGFGLSYAFPPLEAQDTLYFVKDNDLYALDVKSGQIKWRYHLPRHPGPDLIAQLHSSPAELNGVIYIDSGLNKGDETISTTLHKLDAATGRLLSQTQRYFPGDLLLGTKAIGGRVYQNSRGKVYVLGPEAPRK